MTRLECTVGGCQWITHRFKKQLQELRKQSKQVQPVYDLIVNLKDHDVKKNPVDFFVNLHHPKGE